MRITSSAIFKYQQQKSPKKDAPIHFGLCLLAAFVSGALFLFALAPYKIWAVGLLSALVLYALLLLQSSAWRAFGIGWAYGFGTWLTGGFWLYTSIHEYGHIPPVFAFLLIVVMASIMGLFHAVMAWLFVRFLGKQPLAFASLWVIQEWTKTWLLTGFPWLFIGYAFTESPWLASLAPVVGVFGVSFVAVLLASSVLEALRGRLGYLVVTAVLLVVSFALWLINPAWTRPTGERLSVSLVQGNIPQDLKWQSEYRLQTLDIYTALSQSEWGRDLVMWPEAAIPLYSDEAAPFISEMTHRALAN